MLKSAEIGHKLSKAVYAREEPKLRDALLDAQFRLSEANRGPVLELLSGVGAGGHAEAANNLTEWGYPRFSRVIAFGGRNGLKRRRPVAVAYWQCLPSHDRCGR